VDKKLFMLLIAITLIVLGFLALRFQSKCPEAKTLDQFEENKQICKVSQ